MSFSSIPAILRILRIHKIPREPLRGALAIFASCFLWSCESRSSVEVASEEGILIMGNSGEPKGLDPHIVSGVLESNVIRSLSKVWWRPIPPKTELPCPALPPNGIPLTKNSPTNGFSNFARMPGGPMENLSPRRTFSFPFADCLPLPSHPTIPSCFIISGMPSPITSPSALISFRNDANFSKEWWDSLKEIDFGPNEKAAEGSFNFIGLDKLSASQLENLWLKPDLFQWPESVSLEIRRKLIKKNLDFEKSNREKLGKDQLKDLWPLIDFGASAPDDHTLRVELNSPIPFLARNHQALHLVSRATTYRIEARKNRRPLHGLDQTGQLGLQRSFRSQVMEVQRSH